MKKYIFFLLILLSINSFAQDFYVAEDGSYTPLGAKEDDESPLQKKPKEEPLSPDLNDARPLMRS